MEMAGRRENGGEVEGMWMGEFGLLFCEPEREELSGGGLKQGGILERGNTFGHV